MVTTPWWDTIQLRDEIVSASGEIDDVQMSLFNAVHAPDGEKPPYSEALYYGQITHPSQNLVALLASIAIRLATKNKSSSAVYRLDQGMGGGKSHGLVGLWHLAAHPQAFFQTEIGEATRQAAQEVIGTPLPEDLNGPRVVVLACDNMAAGAGNPTFDGPATSLHERFLWRLFDHDAALYQKFQPYHADKSQLAEAIRAVKRPVLILIDEVMDYIRQLSESQHSNLATRDMAFLKALTDVINDVPNAAMIVVMIGSDTMVLGELGEARRTELANQLDRNGKPATVTSNTDFAAILRRRLFKTPPESSQTRQIAAEFWKNVSDAWMKNVFTSGPLANATLFADEVERCYPFHPALLHLAEQEWSNIAGFQRVRSTIRIFAATAYALSQRAKSEQWTPQLIGVGDLPLSNRTVRESILGSGLIADERTQANFRQIAATDVVADDDKRGHARNLDLGRQGTFEEQNPRAGERMATALFLYSIMGARIQGSQGATSAELRAAAFVPSHLFSHSEAEGVLAELKNPETGLVALDGTGMSSPNGRLYFSTRQTVRMLFRAQRNAVGEDERDEEFARLAEGQVKPFPFNEKRFVWVTPAEAKNKTGLEILALTNLDEARRTRLVVLDPRKFSLLNGLDKETKEALRATFGIGEQKLAVGWAPSLVFAVVNTQRRDQARQPVIDYVGWKKVSLLDNVRRDPLMLDEVEKEVREHKKKAEAAIRVAFQHIVYVDEINSQREERTSRFQDDTLTALSGEHVWNRLVEAQKALQNGEFSGKALLTNLQPSDYGRPLDELRDSFWNSARMPLLYGGESDLRSAIFEAISDNKLRLVSAGGEELVCNNSNDINLNNPSQRLALPEEESPFEEEETPKPHPVIAPKPPLPASKKGQEVTLSFTINVSLDDQFKKESAYFLFAHLVGTLDNRAQSVQATVRLKVPEDDAAQLTQHVEALGGRATEEKF